MRRFYFSNYKGMKKDETTKKQTNNEDVRKDLAEIKITIAILQEQVKKLAAVLNVVQPAMYTEEEYREMAEYRRRKDDQKRMAG